MDEHACELNFGGCFLPAVSLGDSLAIIFLARMARTKYTGMLTDVRFHFEMPRAKPGESSVECRGNTCLVCQCTEPWFAFCG